MTRASMLDVLNQDYIRTARTFGLSERLIQWRLALRNALPATLTVAGLSFAYLLTGTFFVELVYDWPGIGQFGTNALLNLDYPVIMGITLFGAIGFLSINLAVDIAQARLDPRVRLE
jgi:peptide/nickel transport system permease protein